MKNALMFMKELGDESPSTVQGTNPPLQSFIRCVLPVVLLKTVYEKNFIAMEAKKAMQLMIRKCYYPETVDVLVEGCQVKNGTLAELSIEYLQEIITKGLDSEYFLS